MRLLIVHKPSATKQGCAITCNALVVLDQWHKFFEALAIQPWYLQRFVI